MHRRAANYLLLAAVGLLLTAVAAAPVEMNGLLPRAAGAPRFVGLFGLALLAAAASFAADVFPYVVRGRPAVGLVTEVRTGDDGNGNFPTVRYTVDGREYGFESRHSSAAAKVGDELRILYLPENPADGWLRHWTHLYLLPGAFAAAAALTLGAWATA